MWAAVDVEAGTASMGRGHLSRDGRMKEGEASRKHQAPRWKDAGVPVGRAGGTWDTAATGPGQWPEEGDGNPTASVPPQGPLSMGEINMEAQNEELGCERFWGAGYVSALTLASAYVTTGA